MGNVSASQTEKKLDGPHPLKEPSFDPNFGFPNGRVERGKLKFTLCLS